MGYTFLIMKQIINIYIEHDIIPTRKKKRVLYFHYL